MLNPKKLRAMGILKEDPIMEKRNEVHRIYVYLEYVSDFDTYIPRAVYTSKLMAETLMKKRSGFDKKGKIIEMHEGDDLLECDWR